MIAAVIRRPRRFWPLYIGWIALCAALFFALRTLDDPARPRGRVLSNDAGARAVAEARARGFRGYEVVHVAGAGGRWLVLLDRTPHTGLREAIVVELDAATGELVRMRKPVR